MKKLFTKVLAASILLASAGLFSSAIAADEVVSAAAEPVASAAASATATMPEIATPAAAVTAPVVAVDAPAAVVAAPAPTPNKGDTAWMMVATMLVILMTIPGLALFYRRLGPF